MSKGNILESDLKERDLASLKKLAAVWRIPKPGADKKRLIKKLSDSFVDPFYLRTILEKLSPSQVKILSIIFNNKNVQTLGDISKKMMLIPLNVEKELQVLKNYCLVYQRKNRERLTSNLDKYYIYKEIVPILECEINLKGDKFNVSIEKLLAKADPKEVSSDLLKITKLTKQKGTALAKAAVQTEKLEAVLESLSVLEKEIVLEVFMNGGVLSINKVRNIASLRKGSFEDIVRHLEELMVVRDVYFIEEKFVRVLVLPKEYFRYMQKNLVSLPPPKDAKPRSESMAFNELDFILNMKKLATFVQRKGLSLAKSGKIKHADLKKSEMSLLQLDIGIYPEKGELYQAELILPILKILNLISLKNADIVLDDKIDAFLKRNPIEILDNIIREIGEVRDKRLTVEDIFEPVEMPFFKKDVFDYCVQFITDHPGIRHNVILANLVRDRILFAPGFKMKNYDSDFRDLRKDVVSALFYLHLLGLIKVSYPDRELYLSQIGEHYFKGAELPDANDKGGIILNPDFSIIALPDKLSLLGIHLLKVFTEFRDFDNVYNFQLTKESFQEGIMLGYEPRVFEEFLNSTTKQELPQNLIFLLEDWSRSLPIISIEDDCVLVKTSDPIQTELLLGQIKGKKIVKEELSPTALIIDKSKIFDLVNYAEKLNMIVKLIR